MVSDQRAQVQFALLRSGEIDELAAIQCHVNELEVGQLLMDEQSQDKAHNICQQLHALVIRQL